MLNKFTHRLAFIIIIFVAVLISGFLLIINNEFEDYYLHRLRSGMKSSLEGSLYLMEQISPGEVKTSTLDRMRPYFAIKRLRLTVVDGGGVVLFDTEVEDPGAMDNHKLRPEIVSAQEKGFGWSMRRSNTLEYKMVYVAVARESYIFRVARSSREAYMELQQLRKKILILGIIVITFGVFLAFYVSRSVGKPIHEIIRFSENFAHGNYSWRINHFKYDEFQQLQKALNSMADLIVNNIKNLEIEERRLKLTLETINDGIAVISQDGIINLSNNALNNYIGIKINPVGQTYYSVIRNRIINSRIGLVLKTYENDELDEVTLGGFTVSVVFKTIMDNDSCQGILLVIHDISERKRIRQIKSDLVSNVSHELKTPVAIIKGYLETIRENPEESSMVEMIIDKAIRNADRQSALINDIIQLNMLENVHDIPQSQVDLQEVIENCIELLKPKINEKRISVVHEYSNLPETIEASRFLAENVLYNLIDNAINYNHEEGEVALSARKEKGKIIISIKDSGIGIPPDSIDRIFERFYRVDKGRSRNLGGTGLGLSIVKHSVELLGWQISVSSSSHGTEFILYI